MNPLRNYLDRIKPNFSEGGKFAKLHSTFDAIETFLFVPNHVTRRGTHIRDAMDLKRTMTVVILAMMPALIFGMYNTGLQHARAFGLDWSLLEMVWFGLTQVVPLIAVSYISGLGVEFIFAQVRKHEVNEGFLVSGMLIPLILPVDIPLWMVAVANIFAVVIGKEAFGGTGMNVLNPALLSRAFLFFAYPAFMTGDKVWVAGLNAGGPVADGFTGATPLGMAASGDFNLLSTAYSLQDLFFGFLPGSIGETSKLAILLGALILIFAGIGSWKIMLSFLAGGVGMSLIFNAFSVNEYMSLTPLHQILMGSFLFGMVFMATDPVTAAQTERGKYIYGFLAGFFAIMIRVFNPAYPEGTMLAILLMNVFAPLIDHYVVESHIKRRMKRSKALSTR